MVEELTVAGEPELVVRDFGGGDGTGPAVVLLHGFGAEASGWTAFAARLTDRHRVVGPDLRCHGRSGDGPWTADALVDDVERVVDALGLDRPAVVGESLGGAVAALWAQRHPEGPGAVDLDGIRAVETEAENYVGLEPEAALRLRAELTATFDAQAGAMAAAMTDEQYEALRDDRRRTGGDEAVAVFERTVVRRAERWYVRPGADAVRAFRAHWNALDLFPTFAAVRSPLLVCCATQDLPDTERYAALMAAYRRGLERDLTAVARANPCLRVEYVPADHGMVHERPAEVAALVRDFLS